MKRVLYIGLVIGLTLMFTSCLTDNRSENMYQQADSLNINLRCINSVVKLIQKNYLVPGQKKVQYKLEYINETWPDTITHQQAQRLIELKKLGADFEQLSGMCKKMEEQSALQLQQLKKLNDEINTGVQKAEDLRQYLTFESMSADSLQCMLDTLVKRAIELNCKRYSL